MEKVLKSQGQCNIHWLIVDKYILLDCAFKLQTIYKYKKKFRIWSKLYYQNGFYKSGSVVLLYPLTYCGWQRKIKWLKYILLDCAFKLQTIYKYKKKFRIWSKLYYQNGFYKSGSVVLLYPLTYCGWQRKIKWLKYILLDCAI